MNMLTRTATMLATGCLAFALSTVGATPALAVDERPVAAPNATALPDGLDAAKKAVTLRIDGRLAALRGYQATVNAATHLSADHRTMLTDLIDTTRKGLTALRTEVEAETSTSEVRADAQRMVEEFRVYMLVGPQVRLTVAADLAGTAAKTLDQVAARLDTAIAAAKRAGKDIGTAEADLASLHRDLDAARAALDGKADALLAVGPGPDAAAIKAQVTSVRQAVRTAGGSLRQAAASAKAVAKALGG